VRKSSAIIAASCFLVVCGGGGGGGGGARTATQRGRVSSHLSGEEPVCESTCYLPMQGSLQNDTQLLAPSEAFGLLHVLECFLVLTILSVHSHACNDNGGNASRDAEAPINSGIHGVCEREKRRWWVGCWDGLVKELLCLELPLMAV
jgi:hypothetical protein